MSSTLKWINTVRLLTSFYPKGSSYMKDQSFYSNVMLIFYTILRIYKDNLRPDFEEADVDNVSNDLDKFNVD